MVKGGSSSVWRYASPLAMPITIFILRVQDSWHPSPSVFYTKKKDPFFQFTNEEQVRFSWGEEDTYNGDVRIMFHLMHIQRSAFL